MKLLVFVTGVGVGAFLCGLGAALWTHNTDMIVVLSVSGAIILAPCVAFCFGNDNV